MYGPKPRPLMVRIWEKIDQATTPDGCWLWKSPLEGKYARIWSEGRLLTVTRVLLERRIGRPLLRTEVARHTCDTPACCRPDHLIVGTHADNTRDASERRRLTGNRTHRIGPSQKLTDEEVLDIRTAYAGGGRAADLAEQYGISITHVRNLARGRFRAAVGGPITRRIVDAPNAEEAA